MKIDDLIGILFLLFFLVGPALRGLLKPREPLVEVELPEELEEVQRRLREAAEGKAPGPASKPQPAARPTAQAQPAPTAATRRAVPAAPAQPAAAAAASQQVAEGHAAGARSRQRIEEARHDAREMADSERAAFAHERGERRVGLPVHRKAIVHGMLWHEILSEPVSRRRARKKKRKLIS